MNLNIKNLRNNGFLIIKDLINKKEILEIEKSFTKKNNSIKNNQNYFETDDEVMWQYLINKKLLNALKKILGEKIYYMHDLDLGESRIQNNFRSWHRDNPCRSTGKGPDWDNKISYNVLTTITYMCSSEETNSNLNFLNKSHKPKYKFSISNILRLFHRKSLKYKKLDKFRFIIEKLIGKEIIYNKGDCIVFFANLYHMGQGVTLNENNRKLIIARFGGPGQHSENFINYLFKHRSEIANRYNGSKKKNDFFNFLKKNNIFYPLPNKKKEIEGVYSKINV